MLQVTFDCAAPRTLSAFWTEALGYSYAFPPNDGIAVLAGDDGNRVLFIKVPEPKSVKNRVHLDLGSGGGYGVPEDEQRVALRAAVRRLETLGATFVEEHAEHGVVWAVMTDPEGNEFCA